MNVQYDVEQLRRRVGVIEHNLADVKRQLHDLEAQVRAEIVSVALEAPVAPVASAVTPVREPKAEAVPPPVPLVAPVRSSPPPPLSRSEYIRTPVEKWDATEAGEVLVEETAPWKAWLQRLQLWPPEEAGGSSEVRLGAWWATRLGTLLAVIGVVFFGVYVSLNTQPWVKFCELLAICGGVAAGGLWLERRMPRFGAVVFSGGLALVYFCAFAGYALPAVKVLSSLPAAMGWQLAAVLLIAGAAVGRKSAGIATMATGLGYVSAVFSRAGGLHEFALVTAAVLAAAAVVFHRWLRWEAPSVVALPGTYAVYALVLQGNWLGGVSVPHAVWPWTFLGGVAALFFARDWRSARVGHETITVGERCFQGVNSSLAVLLGVVTTLVLYRPQLAEFYFGAALLLGIFAALRRTQVSGDAMGAVLLAKAAGAFTLGVIETVDGRTTAVALLVQAWVMLFSARRLGSRVLAAGTGVVALVATGYFFKETGATVPLVSWDAAGALGFVLGINWLAVAAVRDVPRTAAARGGVEWGGAIIAGAAGIVAVHHLDAAFRWEPALLTGVALIVGVPGAWRRALSPIIAGLLVLGAAQVALWRCVETPAETMRLVVNALVVLVPGAVVGVWLGGRKMKEQGGVWGDALCAVGLTLCAVVIGGFAHALFARVAAVESLGIMVLLALGLGGAAGFLTDRHLPWLATWAGLLGMGWWFEFGGRVSSGGWMTVAAVGLWALPAVLHVSRRHAAVVKDEPASGTLVLLQVMTAVVVTLRALPYYASGAAGVAVHAAVALAVFGLWRLAGVRYALIASWALWLASVLRLVLLKSTFWNPGTGYDDVMLVMVALLVWVPSVVLARGNGKKTDEEVQTGLATVLTILVVERCFDAANGLYAAVAALGLTVVVLRLGRVKSAWWAAVVIAAFALWSALHQVVLGRAEGWGGGLTAVLVVAAALVALPLMIARWAPAAGAANAVRWGMGLAALALVFFTAVQQQGTLDPYASVAWGLGAILVFMTGLFARVRPYRMLGLIGLAVCVPRIFVVDLDSALHRIAAFVVLGLVLLWVGFSYHRFRHLITEEGDKNT